MTTKKHSDMWPKGPHKWIENRTLFVSVPFTWNLPEVKHLCLQSDFDYDKVVVGGPAVKLMPDYLKDIAETADDLPGVLQRVNPLATRTTQGCRNRCGFCGVKKIYPEYRELTDWPLLPVVCDDNLLTSSMTHKFRVFKRLRKLEWVDFNQGLQASMIDSWIIDHLCKLKNPIIRIAWDETKDEKPVISAIERLLKAGIRKRNIRCFVLIGWRDTPDEALYRLETITKLGVLPNPMRYNPLDSLERSAHVNTDKGWTEDLLLDYMKYWANIRFFKNLPFEKFRRLKRDRANEHPTLY